MTHTQTTVMEMSQVCVIVCAHVFPVYHQAVSSAPSASNCFCAEDLKPHKQPTALENVLRQLRQLKAPASTMLELQEWAWSPTTLPALAAATCLCSPFMVMSLVCLHGSCHLQARRAMKMSLVVTITSEVTREVSCRGTLHSHNKNVDVS